jgi:hypothetical protein
MDLIRLDSNPNLNPDELPNDHRQTEYGVERNEDQFPESSRLKVNFKRFGLGDHGRSDFAVEITWLDVQGFVREFIEMEHPDALCLERMIRLADAIEGAGWRADDPPASEFWEIIPPQSN